MGIAALGPGAGRSHELPEQRRRIGRAALQFRVGLGADPERVVAQLDELDEAAVGRFAAAHEVGALELGPVVGVELVAVTVALGHDRAAVDPGDLRAFLQVRGVGAEAHGAALVLHVDLVGHDRDHRVRCVGVDLGGVGAVQSQCVAGVLDGHHLEAQTQTEGRDLVFAGVLRRFDLAFDAALTEPAGDHDAVEVTDRTGLEQAGDILGGHPLDLDVGPVVRPGVVERFDDRQVGIGQRHVLADDADPNRKRRRLHPVDEVAPVRQIGWGVGETEQATHLTVEPLVVEHERDVVEALGIGRVDHGLDGNVAERRDLLLEGRVDRALGAAHDDVGLDTAAAQLGHRVLRRLGLLLVGRADERHEREVDVADVLAADVETELSDRLEEREDLDVAHGATDLGDHDIDVVVGERGHPTLDLVGHVGDDLDGLAEIVPAALSREHRRVDRAGRGVRPLGEVLVDEALVVAEVEVGLAAVLGHVDLAVLEGIHRSRVDVDVRVELLHRHPEAPGLQQSPERRGRQPLAEGTRNASGHEDVLGHRYLLEDTRGLRTLRLPRVVGCADGTTVLMSETLRRSLPVPITLTRRAGCPGTPAVGRPEAVERAQRADGIDDPAEGHELRAHVEGH